MSTRGGTFSDSRSGDLTVVDVELDKEVLSPTVSAVMVGGGLLANKLVVGLVKVLCPFLLLTQRLERNLICVLSSITVCDI